MLVPSIKCDHCGKHTGLLYCFGKDKGIAPLHFHKDCVGDGIESLKNALKESLCNPIWKHWDFEKLGSDEGEECEFIDPSVEMKKPEIQDNIKEHQNCWLNRSYYFHWEDLSDSAQNIIKVIVTWNELFRN